METGFSYFLTAKYVFGSLGLGITYKTGMDLGKTRLRNEI